VIRDLPLLASNWRSEISLDDYLLQNKVVAIAGIDTRQLTRVLREKGAQAGCIMAGDNIDEAAAIAAALGFPGLAGMDLAKEVTTHQPYEWAQGCWTLGGGMPTAPHPLEEKLPYHVVAYDYGVKRNILRMLVDRGCRLTVVPAQTPAEKVLELKPDGIFLSNGPGDPEPCDYALQAIPKLIDSGIPVYGICLGHQLLGLASGAKTIKMKFGHHGANHPVKDHTTGKVEIVSMNHGFAVDSNTFPAGVTETHISLFDGSNCGLAVDGKPVFSVQHHPEASPGPQDSHYLFRRFINLIREKRGEPALAER